MNTKIMTLSICASLGVASAANAAGPAPTNLSLMPLKAGQTANFAFSFDGKFGQPQDEIVDDHFAIRLEPSDAVTVTTAVLKPTSLSGKRASDGQITVTDQATPAGDLIVDYNTIVLFTQHAPKSFQPGDTWASHFLVRTSPDSTLDTPVKITVKSANASAITLDADGAGSGTLYFKGFTFPIDVNVHASATFGADGAFRFADFAAKELTQMGAGPTISYSWRVAAQ
jgi:hypothetical protein